MNQLNFQSFLQKCFPFLYLTFFLCLFIGFRAITSICEGGLFLITLLLAFLKKDRFIKNSFRSYFVIGCLLFFLLQVTAMVYTTDFPKGLGQIQIKLTLLLISIAFYYNDYLDSSFRNKIMPLYVLFLASSLLFLFGYAMFDYSVNHDISVFFFHKLVEQFDQHAVQFSILAFIGFIFLLEGIRNQSYILNKPFHFFLIAYFIFFIILLSSKLVIIFSFISILFYISLSIRKSGSFKGRYILSAIVSVSMLFILMTTSNSVSYRFKDIFKGNINVVEKNQFNPGDYFNDIQFRLLQWKLVAEILNEHNAWILGVSPGDAQDLLDKKYISMNMYLGDDKGKSRGYLGYNTHNEFLESTLQNGIVGLIVFLIICGGCIQMMIYSRTTEFWFIGTLLLSYSFVESVFQTQYGVLLFTFFPLFLFYTTVKVPAKESSISSG